MKKIKLPSLLKAEWKHLFKNKMLFISTFVILFIPIMYGGFFLGSIWDPYGSTSNLPIVVVNEDGGATLDGKSVNLGDEIVSNLKNDHNLDWHFESSENAKKGMDENSYYMQISIPSDFSKNAASIATDNVKKSVINYQVAASKNYIGTVISDAAVDKLKSDVSVKLSKAYVDAIFSKITLMSDGMQKASTGAGTLSDGLSKLKSSLSDFTTGLTSYTDGVGKAAGGQKQVSDGLALIKQGSVKLESGLIQMNSQLPSETDITSLKAGLSQIQLGLSQLNTQLSAPSSSTLGADVLSVGGNLTTIGSQLSLQGSDLTALAGQINSSSASQAEKDAMSALITTLNGRLVTQSTAVASAGTTLDDGVASDNDIAGQLAILDAQNTQLKTTIATLNAGMTSANTSAQLALNGFSSIRSATSQLTIGANGLNTGVSSAIGGSGQVLTGLVTLNDNSSKLNGGAALMGNGVGSLNDGSSELYSKLTAAASELQLQNIGSEVSEHIATPITSEKTSKGNVPNYGHALAPYVLSLGLFVGALVFNFIYPIRKTYGVIKNGKSWWLSKFSIGFAAATLQAIVMDVIMICVLGLKPDNLLAFYSVTIATGLAYMAIVMFLAMAFNNPGRFVAMVILVLQLGASGGTFPLQLSNSFFQAISPYLPMTYSILGLRESISSGLGSGVFWSSTLILIGVVVVFNGLIAGMLTLRHKRGFAPDED